MLLLDKTLSTQTIIVTASEMSTVENLRLKVHSTYTNKTFYITLADNISEYQQRFDEFEVVAADMIGWDSGTYQYQIQEYNYETQTVNKIVEVGLLKVIGDDIPTYVSITKREKEDDFLVYTSTQ